MPSRLKTSNLVLLLGCFHVFMISLLFFIIFIVLKVINFMDPVHALGADRPELYSSIKFDPRFSLYQEQKYLLFFALTMVVSAAVYYWSSGKLKQSINFHKANPKNKAQKNIIESYQAKIKASNFWYIAISFALSLFACSYNIIGPPINENKLAIERFSEKRLRLAYDDIKYKLSSGRLEEAITKYQDKESNVRLIIREPLIKDGLGNPYHFFQQDISMENDGSYDPAKSFNGKFDRNIHSESYENASEFSFGNIQVNENDKDAGYFSLEYYSLNGNDYSDTKDCIEIKLQSESTNKFFAGGMSCNVSTDAKIGKIIIPFALKQSGDVNLKAKIWGKTGNKIRLYNPKYIISNMETAKIIKSFCVEISESGYPDSFIHMNSPMENEVVKGRCIG